MRQMERVFADANGWIALNSKRDQLHDIAVRVNRDLLSRGHRYTTTNFVLDESYTGLLTKVGHFAAVDFGEKIRLSKIVEIIHITEEIEDKAWELFRQYSDKTFSFTDCTSFIVMRQFGLSEAFTSDHHFEQMEFTVLLKRA
ncbi:PIN domain-containing protein [Candidatus Poribacteria bacterium]|nr:PIN domain-containing protein [Candidatus Poribacteria bacterium]